MFLLIVTFSCPPLRFLSHPMDKTSASLALAIGLYLKGTLLAWVIFSRCLPEDVDNLKLLNKAVGPKLKTLISLPFGYVELSTFLITSKFESR